ncbi:MAG TPA: alpha-L-rhamnosidase C-terminal domain-containing protein [Acidobacteriaceae bacterium]|jgi:hypothetical protein|nr:alpha-L-rhamnosidase C-terminal domain-containing protein [Acidobacteriaceae bacterium]
MSSHSLLKAGVTSAALLLLLLAGARQSSAQEPLDPVRDAAGAPLERDIHQPLPEQYIWTAPAAPPSDTDRIQYVFPAAGEKTEPHLFRHTFNVADPPPAATLYIAGPRSAEIYLNGRLVAHVASDITQPLGMHVFAIPVQTFLRRGSNTIALKVVRGRGVTGFTNSALVMQQTFGEVLLAKIIPRAPGIFAPAIMLSGPGWKSTTRAATNWQSPDFDDASWKPAETLGSAESTLDLFQWNADAGLYDWPGYDGISPFLAHRRIAAAKILSATTASSSFTGLEHLTEATPAGNIGVHLSSPSLQPQNAPNLILDFGKELTGRLELVSASNSPAQVSIQYGESYDEMLKSPYLGVDLLTIPPHGTGHGPKSSFRYAKIVFVAGAPDLSFRSIAVDDIFYPVKYEGSFQSSDPLLNRIWEVGAYTAHLCMQDDIWDSPKRDRGRWMGDTDVMGRTIEDVFDDHFLMEDTLDRLLGPAPVEQHVNGIPGYSAFWFTAVAQYYRQTGDKAFLEKEHQRMLQLLAYVDKEFDARNLYANKTNVWLFVDWSPELNGDTPESRRATTLEFYGAYRDAAWLLRQLGDNTNADHYEQRAAQIRAGAQKYLLDPATNTFGSRWQTNAAAVLYGVADPSQYDAIWNSVLSQVGHVRFNRLVVTPYYNYYVISAMAKMGHREQALQWMRTYWGGMLKEGATSFWEAYDPDWFKEDFHSSLQADNRSGYFVSLAHGWSSGPAPWLMEQVLGIQSRDAGFSSVDIRPDLLDLNWARGAEPTPNGLLKVSATREADGTVITIDLPAGVKASVSVPLSHPGAAVLIDGHSTPGESAEGGTRAIIDLSASGQYRLTSR